MDSPEPVDNYEHELAVAQMEATAGVMERLARAYEALDQAGVDLPAPIAISPAQLRLVVGW